MGENVIRQDIVQVDFEIEGLKELTKIKDEIDELKKKLGAGVGDDAFDDLKEGAEEAKKSTKKLTEQAEKLKGKLTEIGKKTATAAFNGLKKIASISFKALITGIGSAATALGVLVGKSVSLAGELEQNLGGSEAVFGKYASNLQKTAKEAYSKMGLSQSDYLATANKMGSLFQGAGFDQEKAMDMSSAAMQRAADVASIMGLDINFAMESIAGAAKGNFTMMDNLGVAMNDTTLKAYAQEKGLGELKSTQDKVNVAMQMFLDKTKQYDGNYEKENATYAGALTTLKASWKNTLSAMTTGGEDFDKQIDGLVKSAVNFGKVLLPSIKGALSGVGKLVSELMPHITKELPSLAKELLPPLIKAAVELVKGLVKALPDIIKVVGETIVDILGEQFPALKKFGDIIANNAKKIAKFVPVLIGLFAAFKAFGAIKSLGSLFGGGKSGGGKDGGGLFGGLTGTFDSLAKMKPSTIVKGLANLALIIGGFTLITTAFMLVAPALAKMGDTAAILKMIVIIGALGVLGAVLTKFTSIAGNIPIKTVLTGLLNISIIIAGMDALFLLIAATSLLSFDFGAITKIILIIGLLGTVGAVLTIFAGIVGLIPIATVALGLANMAIVIAGMDALFLLIYATSLLNCNLGRMTKIILIIGLLGTVGAVLSAFAGVVGMIPIPVVLAGLANMALVLGGITGLIVAFGKLTEMDGFTEFLEKGGQTLVKIFGIIGEMVGSLVGGALEGISNVLPQIGKNLAAFGENLKPLFDAFKGIDMDGVGGFFKGLGALIAAMAVDKVISFFGGDNDFSGIAEGLGQLASEDTKKFFNMVNGISEDAFNKGKLFFEALDGISSLPNAGGIGQYFSGENDFSGVSEGIGKLSGQGVKNFFTMVAGFETVAFDNAKLFFESLDGISALPNVGGLGQLFSGKNDFKGVANGLEALSSQGVKNFFAMVTKLDQKAFDNTKSLFDVLADIGNVGEDGFWERVGKAITGDSDKPSGISKIAAELSTFGEKAATFFSQVNGLNLNNLNGLWKSLKSAGELTTQNLGAVIDESLSAIVKKISGLPKKMGDALEKNSSGLSNGFVAMWKEAVKASVAPVNKLLSGANHILKEFGSKKKLIEWQPYAKGTDGHKGGNALVNDGRGAELIQMPNGRMFIPNGRNVFLPNAPKGMKVLPADRTAQLLGRNSPTFRYADGIGDLDVWSYYDNSKGLVNKLKENISYDGMSGFASNVGKSMVSTFASEMPAWIDKLFEESGQSINSYVASKGVMQWLPTVVRALKMEGQYTVANVARTLFQMKTESGGDPRAINLWDSNAKKGIPSKGLMQVIDPTFNAYAREGFDKNIYDPLSNILASVRYATSRYGSLSKAYRGVGYSKGVGTITMPDQTSSINLSYTPESSYTGGKAEVVEYNTYSPTFNFTISGTGDDRAMARKVKRWVAEAWHEILDDYDSKTPATQQV